MTVEELIEQLKRQPPTSEVVIYTTGLSGSCTEISSCQNGFDWYHGKVVIYPKEKLTYHEWLHKIHGKARKIAMKICGKDYDFMKPDMDQIESKLEPHK